MIIKFNYQYEFIEELKKVKLEQPLVRLTNLQRHSEKIAPLRSLFIVSTAKTVNGDIVKLERYCGQLWGIEQEVKEDKKAWEQAESIHSQIKKACEALKLEVRAGIFEER